MNTFIARNKKTKNLIGFFVAEEMEELFSVMDEAGDPYDFEYMQVMSGAMFVSTEKENSDWELKTEMIEGSAYNFYDDSTVPMTLSEALRFESEEYIWVSFSR